MRFRDGRGQRGVEVVRRGGGGLKPGLEVGSVFAVLDVVTGKVVMVVFPVAFPKVEVPRSRIGNDGKLMRPFRRDTSFPSGRLRGLSFS